MPPFSDTDPALWGRSLGHANELEEATRDFRNQAGNDTRLETQFSNSGEYVLLSAARIDSILQIGPDGWGALASRHSPNPFGFFKVSRIGYSRNRLCAFLYVAHYCGGLCGTGRYYFLAKVSGTWQVLFNPGGFWIS